MPQAAQVPMVGPVPTIATEGAFPATKQWKLNSVTQVIHQDTIRHLISDTEKAAIDIVKQLNGDGFDQLTQTILGSLIRPSDNIRDPMLEDVLDSNHTVSSAF
ncbi:hypothetical protein BDR06DRAFT_1006285 [Suillus hirtellus]|nr:hypothetical protein BDR06DRAFT_1006285 [Suillus hirtellus]